MERDFKPPAGTPEATAPPPAPGPERAKRQYKKEKSPNHPPQKTPETAQLNPAEKTKQKIGARVINLFRKREAEAPQPPEIAVSAAEHDITPTTVRAGRMRRLARKVISHVFGEAAAEPVRAGPEGTAPLNTIPLVEAAEDLRAATNDLDGTLADAQETLAFQRGHPSAMGSPDFGGSQAEQLTSAQIVQRVERLEAKVGASNTMSLAALGLGVVAVLVAGHEYFARRRVETTVRKSNQAQRALETQVRAQQQEFAALQKEQVAGMDRQHRQDYYGRLSEFTHQQASSTREVNNELKHSIESALPAPEPLPPLEKQPLTTPEATAQPTQPEPLRRVETGDAVERGSQAGNAGTGFFGGGMSGMGGRLKEVFGTVTRRQAGQMSEEEISAETRRRARLASNAWLYSAGFVVAVAALVLSLVFSA